MKYPQRYLIKSVDLYTQLLWHLPQLYDKSGSHQSPMRYFIAHSNAWGHFHFYWVTVGFGRRRGWAKGSLWSNSPPAPQADLHPIDHSQQNGIPDRFRRRWYILLNLGKVDWKGRRLNFKDKAMNTHITRKSNNVLCRLMETQHNSTIDSLWRQLGRSWWCGKGREVVTHINDFQRSKYSPQNWKQHKTYLCSKATRCSPLPNIDDHPNAFGELWYKVGV